MKESCRNKSSINFGNCLEESQPQKIYAIRSQIKDLMQNNMTVLPTESTLIRNRIFHSCKKHQIPKLTSQKTINQHHEFYSTTNKFVKPYAQHTKYIDSLLKNRHLLRRGPFDVPTDKSHINHLHYHPKDKQHIIKRNKRFLLNTTNTHKNTQTIQRYKKKDLFNNTIQVQMQRFDQLIDQGRDGAHMQPIINRIIAAELITRELDMKMQRSKTLV